MPLPHMRPAPAEIAEFGEGEDPDRYSMQKREVSLAFDARHHQERSRIFLLLAVGTLAGAAPFVLFAASWLPIGLAAAILVVFATASIIHRASATSAELALAHVRSQLVMPFRMVESKRADKDDA